MVRTVLETILAGIFVFTVGYSSIDSYAQSKSNSSQAEETPVDDFLLEKCYDDGLVLTLFNPTAKNQEYNISRKYFAQDINGNRKIDAVSVRYIIKQKGKLLDWSFIIRGTVKNGQYHINLMDGIKARGRFKSEEHRKQIEQNFLNEVPVEKEVQNNLGFLNDLLKECNSDQERKPIPKDYDPLK